MKKCKTESGVNERLRTWATWSAAAALSVLATVSSLGFAPVPPAYAAPDVDAIVPVYPNADSQCVAAGTAGGDGDCRTDNATVYWYMATAGQSNELGGYALETEDRTPTRWIMENVYEPTQLTITYDSTPVFSGAGETDVVFYEGSKNFPSSNTIGVTWCNDPENGTAHLCDQTFIMIRGAGHYSRRSASHEMGHAVGLVHPSKANPSRGPCAERFRVMREALSCIDTAQIGGLLTDNVNWVY